MTAPSFPLDLPSLRAAYAVGTLEPAMLVKHLLEEAQRYLSHNIWIHLMSEAEIEPCVQALAGKDPASLPLYGVPFAIKDNIDLAGIPTTAACAAFAYTPTRNAFIVEQLLAAGAIPIGKTNLDQFATGLVGTRSPEPWGPCKNSLNPDYISGGSSSGSAVAVALGLVSFALGTDTAGSGRVPAMLNNIYGLKPSRGLFSTRGVVPACRSLDCPTVFGLSAADMQAVFTVAARYDSEDSYSRANPYANSKRYWGIPRKVARIAIPMKANLEFFGDSEAEQLFAAAVQCWREQGATIVETDIGDLLAAAKLLYAGPWVAERYASIKNFIEKKPEQMHPLVQGIIAGASKFTAVQSYEAEYQMQAWRKAAQALLADVDFLMTPTAPTAYTINEVLNDPITLNSRMGYYTNYMNLLDLSGIAVPAGLLSSGVGFGVTFIAPAFRDQLLLSHAHQWQVLQQRPVGANGSTPVLPGIPVLDHSTHVAVAVCGAHLAGMPLNWQLTERGGNLLYACKSSKTYRLYALAGAGIARPGLARDVDNGAAIEIEVWSLPRSEFGDFVANIPPPLGIGKTETEHGDWVCGFICEPCGIADATDITHFGGWRAYMKSK